VVGNIDGDGHSWMSKSPATTCRLAWHGAMVTKTLHRRAVAATWFVWLASSDPLPMRVHLTDGVDDWRNRAAFCFDLAMVVRGLAAAAEGGLLDPDPEIVAGLSNALARMIADDGKFDAFGPADADMPARWSTRRGGFLAKAAAGVASAATLPGMAPRVVAAAGNMAGAWLPRSMRRMTNCILSSMLKRQPGHPVRLWRCDGAADALSRTRPALRLSGHLPDGSKW
jgi:hypothetical protein